jgi:hypothetical protein
MHAMLLLSRERSAPESASSPGDRTLATGRSSEPCHAVAAPAAHDLVQQTKRRRTQRVADRQHRHLCRPAPFFSRWFHVSEVVADQPRSTPIWASAGVEESASLLSPTPDRLHTYYATDQNACSSPAASRLRTLRRMRSAQVGLPSARRALATPGRSVPSGRGRSARPSTCPRRRGR